MQKWYKNPPQPGQKNVLEACMEEKQEIRLTKL